MNEAGSPAWWLWGLIALAVGLIIVIAIVALGLARAFDVAIETLDSCDD